MGNFSLPLERLQSVRVPTVVIDGGEASMPWIRLACEVVVDTVPGAEHRTLEGSAAQRVYRRDRAGGGRLPD